LQEVDFGAKEGGDGVIGSKEGVAEELGSWDGNMLLGR
jgi:hypothetical protein